MSDSTIFQKRKYFTEDFPWQNLIPARGMNFLKTAYFRGIQWDDFIVTIAKQVYIASIHKGFWIAPILPFFVVLRNIIDTGIQKHASVEFTMYMFHLNINSASILTTGNGRIEFETFISMMSSFYAEQSCEPDVKDKFSRKCKSTT